MEGLFFYWIFWIAWVIVMFFVPKRVSFRFFFLFQLLAIMVFSRYILNIYSLSIQLSGLYMFFIMCILIRKYPLFKIVKVILHSFIISMAYASFQLFVLLDPIWVMMKPEYLQCLLLNYLVLLLTKEWRIRMIVLTIGMIIGDLVYGGVLTYQLLPYVSLSFSWHDAMVLVLIVQLIWSYLEFTSKWLYNLSQNKWLSKNRREYPILKE